MAVSGNPAPKLKPPDAAAAGAAAEAAAAAGAGAAAEFRTDAKGFPLSCRRSSELLAG